MNPNLQQDLEAVATAQKIAGIVNLILGILFFWTGYGLLLLVGSIIMLVSSGKIRRGEKCFVLAIVGQILCLLAFWWLIPLITIWPLVLLVKDDHVRKALS